MQHLELAFQAWNACAPLREARARFKNYTYGRQWLDPVTTPEGTTLTEGELAANAGARPLTNNMIRQLVKCITGNFRSSLKTASENNPPTETARRNCLDELDCRMLEEFLISGCAIQRVVCEHRIGGTGVWVDNISPARFFVNRFTDPRGSDIELVGMLHDYSLRETLMRFACNDAAKARRITETYGNNAASATSPLSITDFHTSAPGRCRVIEMWTLESRNMVKVHDPSNGSIFLIPASEAEKARSINLTRNKNNIAPLEMQQRISARWHCRFMTPCGMVLDEFDSPYAHGLHPFAVKFYPLTDGEVHSFVEDIVDQQRYVNRLITLIDHIMSTSAKGALLFPTDSKPDSLSWQQLSTLWSKPGAVIPVRSNQSAQMPQQIISGSEPAGAYRLLDLELQLLQQVSGVNNALQGRLESGATSAALFRQQVESSSVAILDILESFNEFRQRRNALIKNC